MCLLKVYLEGEGGRKLIAEEVALVTREENRVRLRSLESMDVVVLEDVYISVIDTLSSVMLLRLKA